LNRLHEEVPGAIAAGSVILEGEDIYAAGVDPVVIRRKIGMVFQKPNPFPSLSIFDNVVVGLKLAGVKRRSLLKEIAEKTLKQAALWDEVKDKLNQAGTSLSGGQKQRIMLARALALNPKILLLDDFTARVDSATEHKILANITNNYPGITLVSVTQKIASVETYDQIIVLMEGEVIAVGKHQELIQSSPEYVQIYNSQKSTSSYELQS
jgi:ATP-binding cassette subfamily B protein